MEKGLIKSFLFSLIAFLVLNFVFFLVGYVIEGTIGDEFEEIGSSPTLIILRLVLPYGYFPWIPLDNFLTVPEIGLKVFYVGFLISFAVSAIIAAFSGGEAGKSFGGWALAFLVCFILFIVAFLIDDFNLSFYCGGCTLINAIIRVLINGIISFLIFGILVLIIALIKSP